MRTIRALTPGVWLALALTASCGSAPASREPIAAEPPRPAPSFDGVTQRPLVADTREPAALVATPEAGAGGAVGAGPEGSSPGANGAAPAEPAPAAGGGSAGAAASSAADPDGPLPIGYVAGAPIVAEELIYEWFQTAPREVELLVEKLVAVRLAYAEAQRLGLRLAPEAVERRFAEERGLFEDSVRQARREVEEVIRSEYRQEPEAYFEGMRSSTIRQMIAERVVRAWTLTNESLAIRLIALPAAKLDEVRQALADGADFAELAKEHSLDQTTAADGGLVPYLVRDEAAPLTRVAFATAVGEVSAPIAVGETAAGGAAGDIQVLLRVEERRPALAGPDWAALGEAIESALAAHPVRDSEFVNWKVAMENRYPIDLEPLRQMLGALK